MSPRLPALERLRGSSRRSKATRALIFATLLICSATCMAPGLYASTDCQRWIKEYRQGILQARAARRLRLAKTRVLVAVHRTHPSAPHRHVRHRMGPLEALRRFQIDCGTLDDVELTETPISPVLPTLTSLPFVPIEVPALQNVTLAELASPLLAQPVTPNVAAPVAPVTVAFPGAVPEPSSLLLVTTGIGAAAFFVYRRRGAASTQA